MAISLELKYLEESSLLHPTLPTLFWKVLGDNETILKKTIYMKTLKKSRLYE